MSKLNNALPEFGNSIRGAVIERKSGDRISKCLDDLEGRNYSEGGCVESSFASDGGAEIF